MTRPVELSRFEAEAIVEWCEATQDLRLWTLAEELRRQWGMGPQPEPPKGEAA